CKYRTVWAICRLRPSTFPPFLRLLLDRSQREEKRRDIPRSAPIPPSRRRRHPKEAGETRDLAPSVLGCPLFLMSTSTFQASLPDHPIRLSCRLISSGNLDVMSLIMSFSCQL
ncbi:hypothetical protein PENTCL1PPCAC_9782, partial [Pristionchus entomophagus]